MKILIVEDEFHFSEKLRRTLRDLGEVVACINDYCDNMPSLEEVVLLAEDADLILLDSDLGQRGYYGEHLLPFLTEKKIIGISSSFSFKLGPINFHNKHDLLHEEDGYYRKKIRSLVKSMIKKHRRINAGGKND